MATGRTLTVAVLGIDGHLIEVDADHEPGHPTFTVAGIPQQHLYETRDRVRAALANSGYTPAIGRLTVRLSCPAAPPSGTGSDLAIGAALLAATGVAPTESTARFVHLGELGLDGRVRPVRAVFPAVLAAVRRGAVDVVVAAENTREAQLVPGARVVPVRNLREVAALHRGEPVMVEPAADEIARASQVGPAQGGAPYPARFEADLADVIGLAEERRALEVAAAGGHHLLMVSAPGAGASLVAARLPGLLPDLDDEQAMEVTAVQSAAGALDPAAGLIRRPPFEAPHHTGTLTSLIGGGSGLARPGAASRAHRGILFLDDVPEYAPGVLYAVRTAVDHGELALHRCGAAIRFPARFQLVLASRPCPCGHGSGRDCTCPPIVRQRYLSRLPLPLLEKIDMTVEVHAPDLGDPCVYQRWEDTSTVAARVAQARAVQAERLARTSWRCNGEVPGAWLRDALTLPPSVTRDADAALECARLPVRGYDQVLRVAWTIADLAGRSRPQREDVAAALRWRQRGVVA